MAIQDDGITTPVSTGAVTTPEGPIVSTQMPGHPLSTDAVTGTGGPVTTEFGPTGPISTGAFETPGPQVSGPQAKVIGAPSKSKPDTASTAETTSTGSVKTQSARHASPAADEH